MTSLAEAARAVDRNGKMGEERLKHQEGRQGQGGDPPAKTRVCVVEGFIEAGEVSRGVQAAGMGV
ncbi:hypothetical protein I79_009226 [Cricetulus griseus]|uniref:Uncharacterized protein n=1 Tax=Cricetulus griseus TaxID=10029 RepID=G3HF71_CRIGR|nr:hypothetical protein I79_009226 [Cricetulus griseus]